MTIITIETTNKATGKAIVKMASTLAEAKRIAIQVAGKAGFLNFKRERCSKDIHVENKGFVVDIMF